MKKKTKPAAKKKVVSAKAPARSAARPKPAPPKAAAHKAVKPAPAVARKPAPAPIAKPIAPPKLTLAPPKPVAPVKGAAKPGAAVDPKAAGALVPKPLKPPKKGGRKSSLSQRKGPNGEPFVPGDLLLPTGPQGFEEIQYLLRGAVAAETRPISKPASTRSSSSRACRSPTGAR